jgi:hypothetical protein
MAVLLAGIHRSNPASGPWARRLWRKSGQQVARSESTPAARLQVTAQVTPACPLVLNVGACRLSLI